MKHRIAITQTMTIYYNFEGTTRQANALCKKINNGTFDDLDEIAEFDGESDWTEHSNAHVVESTKD